MEIRTASPCLFPFLAGDKVFVDGYRVLNPHEPVRLWNWSTHPSPTSAKTRIVGHWPWSISEAHSLLRGMHAVELYYDHTPGVIHAYTGSRNPVYVNLRDGKSSWARDHSFPCHGFRRDDSFAEDSWVGGAIRDGAKFSSSFGLNPQKEQFVVIKQLWLSELMRMLNAHHYPHYDME